MFKFKKAYMKNSLFTALLTVCSALLMCAQTLPTATVTPKSVSKESAMPTPIPPIAKKIPKKMEAHGDVRVDDYYWMNQREDPEVIAYLNAENAYLLQSGCSKNSHCLCTARIGHFA